MSKIKRYGLPLLVLLGLLVRSQRLDWQPLWWDEGYSVYFATESLARMFWLTAHDIHPPLYYALLHGWITLFQSTQPTTLRLFSVVIGGLGLPLLAWLAALLFPQQPRRWLLATLLLLVSPIYLFYSQEIRMYGLAMILGLASTICLWIGYTQTASPRRWLAQLGYGLTSTLALYTLYYLAFLLLAHALWLLWQLRRDWRRNWHRLGGWLIGYVLIGLLYTPWLLYAGTNLIHYVLTDKIPSDADRPLGLIVYLFRHLLAFTAGHIEPTTPLLGLLHWGGLVGLALLLVTTLPSRHLVSRISYTIFHTPHSLLLCCLLIPGAIAFLINRNLPFFPPGGERLLLFVLPYFLLFVSAGLDRLWQVWGRLALAGLLLSAFSGLWLFYTTARYQADDYRSLLRQIVQQGAQNDTVLALFPWEVGYWRAYAAQDACPLVTAACTQTRGLNPLGGPTITLAGEGALRWEPALQTLIDQALRRGTLWFPAPLALGSTLPGEIEAYLIQRQATNLENRWVSSTTRLTAWRQLPLPARQPNNVDFGPVRLLSAGVAPTTATSANQPINLALEWQVQAASADVGVTLRLQDELGHTWASRDYAPLGSLAVITTSHSLVEQVGLLTPVGLPPANYQLWLGVTSEREKRLLTPHSSVATQTQLVALGQISITQPLVPAPLFQLPIQHVVSQPDHGTGIQVLGYSGLSEEATLLAGEAVELTLFLGVLQPPTTAQQIYISLLDVNGAGVAGWEGQSPARWPSTAWPVNGGVQAPVAFFTPATLPSGNYQLIAGLRDPTTGAKSQPTLLGGLPIEQRKANFTRPPIPRPFDPPVELGTHVLLLGYDLQHSDTEYHLTLYWQVQQSLLPPHHIFVHLDDANGATLAQADDEPQTSRGPAPTGSWQPGEYLITQHQLTLPTTNQLPATLRIGLYLPTSQTRLATSINGQITGDAVEVKP